jgi:hypothetical protein
MRKLYTVPAGASQLFLRLKVFPFIAIRILPENRHLPEFVSRAAPGQNALPPRNGRSWENVLL